MPPQGPPPGYPPPGAAQPGGAATPDTAAAFQYGWAKFQENIGPIAIAIVAWIVISVIGFIIRFGITGIFQDLFDEETTDVFGNTYTTSSGGFFAFLVVFAVGMVISMAIQFLGSYAIIRGSLAITAGRELNTGELFATNNMVPYLVTSLLSGLVIGIGYLLCIIPGIIAAFLLWLAPFYSAERGMGAIDAMKTSAQVMQQQVGTMLIFFIAVIAAFIVGALLCGIGLLVTMPVSLIASAYMFRALNNEPVAA